MSISGLAPSVDQVFAIVGGNFNQLGLVVGLNPTQVLETSRKHQNELHWPELRMNQALAEVLRDIPSARRGSVAEDWARRTMGTYAPGPVLCTEIELLFKPSLKLDPLRLFEHASNSCRLVLAWPGGYDGSTLTYAVPEHRHYWIWRQVEHPVAMLNL